MDKWDDRDMALAFHESIRSIDQSYWSGAGDSGLLSAYAYRFICISFDVMNSILYSLAVFSFLA
jgi:hypothetical protein